MTRPSAEHAAPLARDGSLDAERVALLHRAYGALRAEIARVIVGQEEVIELLLTALFSGGHAILIGVPGLAKTLLVKTLSRLLSLSFKRIQFTPDLMPSDVTGTDILHEDPETGSRELRFVKGPVFTNLLLADEINRTPPKTQAALLEAMQERQVTVGDHTMSLPTPFFVIATQNPIEQEGTYNLPEAQLDRFLFSLRVRYPREDEELEIMKGPMKPEAIPLEPVLGAAEILEIQDLVHRVPVADHVYRFALELVRLSRPEEPRAPREVRECLSWGAGPRAAQSLIHSARARALLNGRFHATTGDVEAVALPVLSHRLVANFNAEAEGVTPEAIVERLLAAVPREVAPGDTGRRPR
jgi:MoxR-like ATPase